MSNQFVNMIVRAAMMGTAMCSAMAVGMGEPRIETPILEFLPDDGASGDQFGIAVGINDEFAVVGADRNAAHGAGAGSVYVFNSYTGELLHKLVSEDISSFDTFGASLELVGDRVLVGSPNDIPLATLSGSAYLFDVSTGELLNKFLPTDGVNFDMFGASVAFDQRYALIGAPDEGATNAVRPGAVYVFDMVTNELVTKITPEDPESVVDFGNAVEIDGDYALIAASGAFNPERFGGAVYVYDTTSWELLHRITPVVPSINDLFGESISLHGGLALIGSSYIFHEGQSSGAVYLYDVETGERLMEIVPDDLDQSEFYGASVELTDDLAVVGSLRDTVFGRAMGSVYIFDVHTGDLVLKLAPEDGETGEHVGKSIAVHSSKVLVGAWRGRGGENQNDSGSSYLFNIASIGPCAPDLNGDGLVNFYDVSAFYNAYVAGGSLADINGDGVLNYFDVSAFLEGYISGCL